MLIIVFFLIFVFLCLIIIFKLFCKIFFIFEFELVLVMFIKVELYKGLEVLFILFSNCIEISLNILLFVLNCFFFKFFIIAVILCVIFLLWFLFFIGVFSLLR